MELANIKMADEILLGQPAARDESKPSTEFT